MSLKESKCEIKYYDTENISKLVITSEINIMKTKVNKKRNKI